MVEEVIDTVMGGRDRLIYRWVIVTGKGESIGDGSEGGVDAGPAI